MTTDFATKLNRLFEIVHPRGRPHLTNVAIVSALAAQGRRISSPYLSQLRRGTRTQPSRQTIEALARCFKVGPEYFTDDDYAARVYNDLTIVSELHGYQLRRLICAAFDLSEESKSLLIEMAEKLRLYEGLPPDEGDTAASAPSAVAEIRERK
ncbi:transcriptional regulator [Nocardia noduli]|uniref:transcriptional regulator n=1 Tax=Nocardia noduli TaxID=2815722 RepID=UPI001C215BDE|nr:transcriptional regulator [Nocardia noduli]